MPLCPKEPVEQLAKVTKPADLGTDWAPRDMRHTFVSVLSANVMTVEQIARLVGHTGGSRVTEGCTGRRSGQ
ncbi:site-specific recombinase XerD [Catenulispora sp. EB89]